MIWPGGPGMGYGMSLRALQCLVWPGREGMGFGIVYAMVWRAWHGIWYGLRNKEWCMVWPGGHSMIYSMAWRPWHGICYGLAGITWCMLWLGGHRMYMVWPGEVCHGTWKHIVLHVF